MILKVYILTAIKLIPLLVGIYFQWSDLSDRCRGAYYNFHCKYNGKNGCPVAHVNKSSALGRDSDDLRPTDNLPVIRATCFKERVQKYTVLAII